MTPRTLIITGDYVKLENMKRGTVAPIAGDADRKPLPLVSVDQPVTIVIFGASGDLTQRKLLPALYALYSQRLLRDRLSVIGIARRNYTTEFFRDQMRDAIRAHSRAAIDEADLDRFVSRIFYQRGDVDDAASFRSLQNRIADVAEYPANHIFYLAVAPEHFSPIIAGLHEADLIHEPRSPAWSRIVIEKPFGRDLESARALNREVLAHLDESQIYRIDHYLGKETVQNILGFRFANAIFEPLFNNNLVDHIQITAAETLGVERGRGAYYDSSGALRDMVQNHLLQLLCLVGMEPPADLKADSIHREKTRLLGSIIPPSADAVAQQTIRGQYRSGRDEKGEIIPAYVQEEHIAANSSTETYCALQLSIENWRWAGVPVFLRTGKRLKRRGTEIAIQFKKPPLQLFRAVECDGDVCDLTLSHPNVLVFRIQPDEGIAFQFSAKRPAMQFVVESVAMDFSYRETWKMPLSEAYERLLLDVMRGDATLFTRSDEVEAAWRIVDPILQAWKSAPGIPLAYYDPGSWGPEAADTWLRKPDRQWINPDVGAT